MSSTELRVKELLRSCGWTTKVLAEKTGLSESYLTHIKNGTRRWNEDALKKLAAAFGVHPVDLFAQRRSRTDNVDSTVKVTESVSVDLQLKIVPVVGEIPTNPSPYNNQIYQVTKMFSCLCQVAAMNRCFAYALKATTWHQRFLRAIIW